MPGSLRKPINVPARTPALAELVGIMMGDGGMSRYQATITLHHVDDYEYSRFVAGQIEALFKYSPRVRHRPSESTLTVVMSRIAVVDYLHSLGLPIGDKLRAKLSIPGWVQENSSLLTACIRGLMDTDGCVFTHRYVSKGKWYSYKKLSFTSMSSSLLVSVRDALNEFGYPRA